MMGERNLAEQPSFREFMQQTKENSMLCQETDPDSLGCKDLEKSSRLVEKIDPYTDTTGRSNSQQRYEQSSTGRVKEAVNSGQERWAKS